MAIITLGLDVHRNPSLNRIRAANTKVGNRARDRHTEVKGPGSDDRLSPRMTLDGNDTTRGHDG